MSVCASQGVYGNVSEGIDLSFRYQIAEGVTLIC